MRLLVNGMHCGDCLGVITNSLLKVDLGARINFNPGAHDVRIEGRLTLRDAITAIEQGGFSVASVLDSTIADAVSKPRSRGGPRIPGRGSIIQRTPVGPVAIATRARVL